MRNNQTSNQDSTIVKAAIRLSGIGIAAILLYTPFGLYSAAQQGKINRELEQKEHTKYIFREFDKNKDDFLDESELLNYLKYNYFTR